MPQSHSVRPFVSNHLFVCNWHHELSSWSRPKMCTASNTEWHGATDKMPFVAMVDTSKIFYHYQVFVLICRPQKYGGTNEQQNYRTRKYGVTDEPSYRRTVKRKNRFIQGRTLWRIEAIERQISKRNKFQRSTDWEPWGATESHYGSRNTEKKERLINRLQNCSKLHHFVDVLNSFQFRYTSTDLDNLHCLFIVCQLSSFLCASFYYVFIFSFSPKSHPLILMAHRVMLL